MRLLGQIADTVNNSQGFDFWKFVNDYQGFIAFVAAGAAIASVLVSAHYERGNFQSSGLQRVFDKLNDTKNAKQEQVFLRHTQDICCANQIKR